MATVPGSADLERFRCHRMRQGTVLIWSTERTDAASWLHVACGREGVGSLPGSSSRWIPCETRPSAHQGAPGPACVTEHLPPSSAFLPLGLGLPPQGVLGGLKEKLLFQNRVI